ncbi:MAG: CoA-binding protein [Betaproteobacteria bacterium]|nr:CoA-binding protein [Betaproteobacteria bacterium]
MTAASFVNPSGEEVCARLKQVRRIAVVGLSPNPSRPSHGVARALQGYGFEIVPVRPKVTEVLGAKAYAGLAEVPGRIDLVDVFRAPEYIPDIVAQCIALKIPALWLQEGIVHAAAANRARAAGLWVVMDRCLYRDYAGWCR